MKELTTDRKKIPKQKEDRIERAEKDFKKMMERIKPFTKKREAERVSTAGKWTMYNHY